MSNIKPLFIIVAFAIFLACNNHSESNNHSDTANVTSSRSLTSSVTATPQDPIPLQCPNPQEDSLTTPLHGQESPNWCWAASAQMIFATLHDTIHQCDAVALRVPRVDCCGATTPAPCDITGWPPFKDFGFYADSTPVGIALRWDSIQRQIGCLRTPICTRWRWTDSRGQPTGGSHFVVLVAYKMENGEQTVTILNPAPWPDGHSEVMSYDDFVQSTEWGYIHGKDYFNIKKEASNR